MTLSKESITSVDMHVFGDTSVTGSSAIVHQSSITNQRLVLSKSCISYRNSTILRLELVSAHAASNLIESKKAVLERCNIK